MSDEQSFQLWDQVEGQTLTPLGWMPNASVEEQRRKTRSLANWAYACGAIGLLLCGPLALVGIALGFAARARGVRWGAPVGWGPVILSSIAVAVWVVFALFAVSSSLSSNTTQVPQSQGFAPQTEQAVQYQPAIVDIGPLSVDEFGLQEASVTITNPVRNSGSCTFVVAVTADSQDGMTQYDSGAVSVSSLQPGQSYTAPVTFTNGVPSDAVLNAAEAECLPD